MKLEVEENKGKGEEGGGLEESEGGGNDGDKVVGHRFFI